MLTRHSFETFFKVSHPGAAKFSTRPFLKEKETKEEEKLGLAALQRRDFCFVLGHS